MYESSFENTPDSQSIPFIDNSHMIQMPHIFNHGEAKTFSEKTMPSKQPSTKETCRCNIKNVQRSSNLEFHGYDNITTRSSIKLSRPCLNDESNLQKVEYRSNIEKYCLNLNPYSSKYYKGRHEQFRGLYLYYVNI